MPVMTMLEEGGPDVVNIVTVGNTCRSYLYILSLGTRVAIYSRDEQENCVILHKTSINAINIYVHLIGVGTGC